MRLSLVILSLPILLLLGACQSLKRANPGDATPSLAAVLSAEVPLPATTTFDSYPEARTAYLEAYRDGYRSGLTSLNILVRKPDERDRIRSQGWRAGMNAGFRRHITNIINKSQLSSRGESSPSYRYLIAQRPDASWMVDYTNSSYAVVAIGADMDENFRHRWNTLQVWPTGKVDRMVICPDCENDQQWVEDK